MERQMIDIVHNLPGNGEDLEHDEVSEVEYKGYNEEHREEEVQTSLGGSVEQLVEEGVPFEEECVIQLQQEPEVGQQQVSEAVYAH